MLRDACSAERWLAERRVSAETGGTWQDGDRHDHPRGTENSYHRRPFRDSRFQTISQVVYRLLGYLPVLGCQYQIRGSTIRVRAFHR